MLISSQGTRIQLALVSKVSLPRHLTTTVRNVMWTSFVKTLALQTIVALINPRRACAASYQRETTRRPSGMHSSPRVCTFTTLRRACAARVNRRERCLKTDNCRAMSIPGRVYRTNFTGEVLNTTASIRGLQKRVLTADKEFRLRDFCTHQPLKHIAVPELSCHGSRYGTWLQIMG